MRYVSLIGLFLGVAILQTSPYNPFTFGDIKPDFFLLVVIYLNLFVYDSPIIWTGFFGGILEDLLSGGPFGSAALTKSISGYGVSLLRNKVVFDNPFVQALLVFVVSLLEASVRFFVLNFLGIIRLGIWASIGLIITQAFLTTLLAPPFFWLLRQGQRRWAPNL